DSAPAPGSADAKRTDEPAAEPLRIAADDTCNLRVFPREKPERRVGVARLEPESLPFLERHRDEAPVIRERLVERCVKDARILGSERRNADAHHRLRRGRGPVEVDLHPVEATDLAKAELFEQLPCALVFGEHARLQPAAAEPAHGLLRAGEELGGDSTA